MYSKESLNTLYTHLVRAIDISDVLFEKAVAEYKAFGKWIDAQTPDYQVSIYPQGSFALGTVIKPITDKDDYDLDLVCEFAEQHELTARQLKIDIVQPLLKNYRKISGDIIEKRRCWHVEYEEIPNFHMDIVPAVNRVHYISITDHDEDSDSYSYIGSNPAGYIDWFFGKSEKQRSSMFERYLLETRSIIDQSDVEDIKRRKIKTPLQRAIQLLKRHRDIMFEKRDQHSKPVSVIITTIAAQLYQEEDSVVDALSNIIGNAETYIIQNKHGGQYYIENPSYQGENFADKWNEDNSCATVFFEWLNKAQQDLVDGKLLSYSRVQMASNMKCAMGSASTERVFSEMAKEEEEAIAKGKLKIETKTGMLSASGTISIPPNHHYGE